MFRSKHLIVFLFVSGLIILFPICRTNAANATDTESVSLTATVNDYIALATKSGGTIALGAFLPGTPTCSNTATVMGVTTNAANGYTLGLSDDQALADGQLVTDSSLHQGTVYIPDFSTGTLAAPVVWGTPGTNRGLGVGLFAADNTGKEIVWGTGTAVCDALNKYAPIPKTAATGHTLTGYHAAEDTSSWGWKIDVPATQKTGAYAGTVTFTATTVLT